MLELPHVTSLQEVLLVEVTLPVLGGLLHVSLDTLGRLVRFPVHGRLCNLAQRTTNGEGGSGGVGAGGFYRSHGKSVRKCFASFPAFVWLYYNIALYVPLFAESLTNRCSLRSHHNNAKRACLETDTTVLLCSLILRSITIRIRPFLPLSISSGVALTTRVKRSKAEHNMPPPRTNTQSDTKTHKNRMRHKNTGHPPPRVFQHGFLAQKPYR